MTESEILRKCIEKAEKNGFKYKPFLFSDGVHKVIQEIDEILIYEKLIFNHSFAKAFFGDGIYIDEVEDFGMHELGTPLWQCGLMELALSEDRLKYLSQFLD